MPREKSMMIHVKHKFICRKKSERNFKPPKEKQPENKRLTLTSYRRKEEKTSQIIYLLFIFLLVNLLQDEVTVNIFHITKELLFPSWHTKNSSIVISMWFSLQKIVNENLLNVFVRSSIGRISRGWAQVEKVLVKVLFHLLLWSFNMTQLFISLRLLLLAYSIALPPDSFLRIKWVVKFSLAPFFLTICRNAHAMRWKLKIHDQAHQHFYRLEIFF